METTTPTQTKKVFLVRRIFMSGKGGMCSIAYGCYLYDADTRSEVASTKAVAYGADWREAGRRLAKRKGYEVVARPQDVTP